MRTRLQLRDVTKPLGQAAVGALTIGILRTARRFDPTKTANLFARITRSIGPMMREQKIGRANLAAAFPEKSPAEIEAILAGIWDNLGRVELSEEVKPVRDAAGQIDIQGTMQAVTSVIEGWIREYPDQWLWLHRRWR